jgi:hypothetical protein
MLNKCESSGQLRGKLDRAGLPGYLKLLPKKPFSWLAHGELFAEICKQVEQVAAEKVNLISEHANFHWLQALLGGS